MRRRKACQRGQHSDNQGIHGGKQMASGSDTNQTGDRPVQRCTDIRFTCPYPGQYHQSYPAHCRRQTGIDDNLGDVGVVA